MAEIYNKTVDDNTLILDVRQSVTRQYNLGTSWNEVLFGMYCTGVANPADDTAPPIESVTWHTITDAMFFGFRTSGSTAFPMSAGCNFIGIVNNSWLGAGTEVPKSTPFQYTTQSGQMKMVATSGTSIIGGGTWPAFQAAGLIFPSAALTTGYNGFNGFRMRVNNLGLATQTITMQQGITSPIAGADYSIPALQAQILSQTWGAAYVLAWNVGGVALPLPDCVYIYLPFYNCRLRISAMEFIRIS